MYGCTYVHTYMVGDVAFGQYAVNMRSGNGSYPGLGAAAASPLGCASSCGGVGMELFIARDADSIFWDRSHLWGARNSEVQGRTGRWRLVWTSAVYPTHAHWAYGCIRRSIRAAHLLPEVNNGHTVQVQVRVPYSMESM